MRIYLESLGCRLNAAEIEAQARQFAGAGHCIVTQPDAADIIVLNSCAVTAQASRKSRHRISTLHRESPAADLAVIGCWATEDVARAQRLEGVRWVVPNADKAQAVTEILGQSSVPAPWSPGRWGHTRAFLGVQDGCDHACTYCITRVLRGPPRSRPLRDAVTEVQRFVEQGAQEVVLTGVSLGAYGRDLGLEAGLAQMVTAILRDTHLPRLRLSSIEPWDVTSDFLALWQDSRLCRQLHLPLQSGSAAVLKRMGRRITVAEFASLVETAYAICPDMAITTDIIAGFPGETETDFSRTMTMAEEMRFARIHVFPYSERSGTAAVGLPDPVAKGVRKERARELRDLGARLAAAYRSRFVGRVLPVLWMKCNDDGDRFGLTDNYLKVRTRDARDLYNRITPARMAEGAGDVLGAEVLDD
ncbi:MAG: MiaB/RimO family radical SAM methylthiotransferase [Anaerolineae bacterium]|nr:MiaB/RimO family radical SAM methylthiotransferase [Anaerolineae bacterium]